MESRVYGLDVMRATAILMVLLSHTNYILQDYEIKGMQVIGVQGVELFFVLSGFLIGSILLRIFNSDTFTGKRILRFWVRRWFRTLPLYFLMLAVNILMLVVVGHNLSNNIWKYVFFFQNLYEYDITFFPESWSLSVEEYAYILAPMCLYISHRMFKKIKNKDKLFLWTSFFLVFLFFVSKWCYHFSNTDTFQSLISWNSNLKAIVIYRLDAVFYGFIMAFYFNKYNRYIEQIKFKLFLLGIVFWIAIIIFILLFGGAIEQFSLFWNVFLLPINSICICLILPMFYFLNAPRGAWARIIKNISLYSYAMYLLQYSFILYIMQLWFDFDSLDSWQRIICVLCYLILTYVFSNLIYKYFESPFTNLRDSLKVKQFFKV